MIRKNKVKEILRSGGTAIGTFESLADPTVIEIMGLVGFDFVVIDNEHVAMDRATLTNLIRASEIAQVDIVPIVRIRDTSTIEIAQTLDSGALGLQLPEVNTYEQAKEIIDSAYYAPIGNRGLGTVQRGIGYGFMDRFAYFEAANKEILTVMQCESLESVNNIEKILEIEEIDVVFVGAMDLSQSMGADIMGRRRHPELVKVFNDTVKRIIDCGKVAGAAVGNLEGIKEMQEMGVRYITLGMDIGFIRSAASQIIETYKSTL